MTPAELKLIEDAAGSIHVSDEATRAIYKLIDEWERRGEACQAVMDAAVKSSSEEAFGENVTAIMPLVRAALGGEEKA